MKIHMAGLRGPETELGVYSDKNGNRVVTTSTLLNGKVVNIVSTDNIVSFYKHDNGYYSVLINDGVLNTAMLLDGRDGYVRHSCFTTAVCNKNHPMPTGNMYVKALGIEDLHIDKELKTVFMDNVYMEMRKMWSKALETHCFEKKHVLLRLKDTE